MSDITSGYSELYFHLNSLFERGADKIKIGDLASITYWTQAGTPANGLDWAIRIYTVPQVGQPQGQWFNKRFHGKNPGAEDSEWHEWDAGTSGWFSSYHDRVTNKSVTINYTLEEVAQNFGNDEILYFAFYIGADSNTKSLFNQIDNITFTLTNGDEVHIKLIPEPAAFTFLAASGVAYALFRRKRLG